MERAALLRSTPLACTRFFLRRHRPFVPFRHLRHPIPPPRSNCTWRLLSSASAASSSPSASDGFSRGFSTVPVRAIASPTQPSPEAVDAAERYGFEKVSEEFIKECKSTATLYQHKKTGAQVMSVSNDDENKVFGIVFRTPPSDSTGIPHILEHFAGLGNIP